MSSARYLIGDVFDRMAQIPDGSVDLIVTSPPFLALRSYLPEGHPDKGKEIGSEPTPAAFLDTLLALSAEWRRVLAPHGSICVELGDTYAGSGGAGGDYGEDGLRAGQARFQGSQARNKPGFGGFAGGNRDGAPSGRGWPLGKSLCGIPTLYPWSLAYGRNLLTGEVSPAGQWRIRNLLCWARPNPPVGSLGGAAIRDDDGEKIGKQSGERFRTATSYVTVACVSDRRWFDLDAVRTEHTDAAPRTKVKNHSAANPRTGWTQDHDVIHPNPAGAPPLDWWDDREATWEPLIGLPTQPYKGSHYATFPTRLPAVLIDAMCPREVCVECGRARERITEASEAYAGRANAGRSFFGEADGAKRERGSLAAESRNAALGKMTAAEYVTLGWTDCNHGQQWRRGVVLDPFAGSGTTLAAATGLGRDAIGIDLDARNADLARERCGMFLDVAG